MLISTGSGGLVAFIRFACVPGGSYAARGLFGPNTSNGLCNLTRGWMAASVALLFGLLLRLDKTVVRDPESGHDVVHRQSHTLFFIPVIYRAAIFSALGIAGYIHG